MKNLRWKLITVVALFALFFAFGVYPILAAQYKLPAPQWLKDKQLKLGLDLKGGVHLVLRVHTDEALQIHTTTTVGQVRGALRTASVGLGSLAVTSPTAVRAEGVPQDRDAEFRRVVEDLVAANYD